jgi:hypothetical protein
MSASVRAFLQRYGLTALIGGAIASVIIVVGWETGWGRYLSPGVPKIEPGTRKAEEIALLPEHTLPPMAQAYKETVEKPLFSQSRRPIPPAPVVAAVPTMQKGKYRLAGTVVNADASAAFLVEIQSGKTFRVAKGSAVNPNDGQAPKLDSVSPTQVVLKLGDDTEMLTLATAKSPAAGTQVADAQGAGQRPGQTGLGAPGMFPQPSGGAQAPGSSLQPVPGGGLPMPLPGPGGGPMPLPANSPGITPLANVGGGPVPLPPGSAPGLGQPTVTQTPPTAPESTALRRRRFQNLPQ